MEVYAVHVAKSQDSIGWPRLYDSQGMPSSVISSHMQTHPGLHFTGVLLYYWLCQSEGCQGNEQQQNNRAVDHRHFAQQSSSDSYNSTGFEMTPLL